jgi:hypothetical protein
MSLFFEELKQTKSFNESIDATSFLEEMVTTQYTGVNYEFAQALEEAYNEDYLLSLNEEDKLALYENIAMLESRLDQIKEICALNEGFGIVSWWKLHATGADKKLGEKVAKKIASIKTEEEKQELIRDLQKVKKTAQTLSGTKDSNKGDFWKDLWVGLKSGLATGVLGHLAIIPQIIRLVRTYNGTVDDFVKGIDALIADVKAVKVSKK